MRRLRHVVAIGVVLLAVPAVTRLASAAPQHYTRVTCAGDSCRGRDPQATGCSADAQRVGLGQKLTITKNRSILAELRYSPACQAGWIRVASTQVELRPSAWTPGEPSVHQAATSSVWSWTGMVSATNNRQICGGTHIYNLFGQWLRWWFVGCFRASDATTPTPTPQPTTYTEQEYAPNGANTFTNYHNASGVGQHLDFAQSVQVSCKVYDPFIKSVNPDGYWYRIASAPWNDGYYAAANTFLNGDPPGGPYSRNTDFAVPDC
jgi:hypothetical protein